MKNEVQLTMPDARGDLFSRYPSFREHIMVNNGHVNRPQMIQNSALTEDAWKEIDDRVVEIAQQELSAAMRLEEAGLSTNVGNLGVKFWQWNQVDDPQDAAIDMDFSSTANRFSVDFADEGVPMPIIHIAYDHGLRDQLASENAGIPLDTTADRLAAKMVSRKIEDLVVNGTSDVQMTVNGTQQNIEGYTNATNRQTVTINASWTDSPGSADEEDDILSGIQQLRNNGNFNGPYDVYIPNEYARRLEEQVDTSSGSQQTYRDLLEGIEFVNGVFITDQLADDEILVVDMDPAGMTVELGTIEPIQTVDISDDQFGTERMVFACLAPGIKNNVNSQAGIAHIS